MKFWPVRAAPFVSWFFLVCAKVLHRLQAYWCSVISTQTMEIFARTCLLSDSRVYSSPSPTSISLKKRDYRGESFVPIASPQSTSPRAFGCTQQWRGTGVVLCWHQYFLGTEACKITSQIRLWNQFWLVWINLRGLHRAIIHLLETQLANRWQSHNLVQRPSDAARNVGHHC